MSSYQWAFDLATGACVKKGTQPLKRCDAKDGGIKAQISAYEWFYGNLGRMKTTLELPDKLMRRVKLRAVHRNQKLNEAIAQLLEAGIAALPAAKPHAHPPKPVRLKKQPPLTIDAIEAAIAAGADWPPPRGRR